MNLQIIGWAFAIYCFGLVVFWGITGDESFGALAAAAAVAAVIFWMLDE